MKSLKKLLGLVGALALTVSQSSALNLAVGDAYYLGSVNPANPSNEESEALFINYLIDMSAPDTDTGIDEDVVGTQGNHTYTFTRSANVFAGLTDVDEDDASSSPSNPAHGPIDVDGVLYLYGKFGNTGHIWVVSGITEDVTLPDLGRQSGLSHYAKFSGPTTVPDGGATAALLGVGMFGLAALRRRIK